MEKRWSEMTEYEKSRHNYIFLTPHKKKTDWSDSGIWFWKKKKDKKKDSGLFGIWK